MTEGDVFDIDCQTGQSSSLRTVWARNITDEVSKRGMTVRGTLTERQQQLRQRLVSEQRAYDIAVVLADSEPCNVPCSPGCCMYFAFTKPSWT
jgi:hypothetical protein